MKILHRITGEVILDIESLTDADLRRADLYGADLRDADLRGADLRGARRDADLISAAVSRKIVHVRRPPR